MSANWIEKLQKRWGVKNAFQVIVILIVFACTGFTVLFLKKPIFILLGFDPESLPTWFVVLYYILILPIYQVILLIYGFVFGQFQFFWEFEKRMFTRMKGKRKEM